jgi:hypothetical protein
VKPNCAEKADRKIDFLTFNINNAANAAFAAVLRLRMLFLGISKKRKP